ncbi:DNA replication protein DnaC [Streptacidiphilus sp. BW17]|uniref:ATP-binding protein n=1 Tax=Streptacidiphilus sp. BW17 TaxID=3156274 RepID=UPI0035114DD2
MHSPRQRTGRDPQLASSALQLRMDRILAERGIDLALRQEQAEPAETVSALDLAQARIPLRFQHAEAEHPDVRTWVRRVTGSCRQGPGGMPGIATGPSLLLAGPTGVGKTFTAYGAIRALLADGVRLQWQAITAADLYADQRPKLGHDTERDFNALARTPLLMLDDLGAAKTSEWTEELTYRLVNYRYDRLLPTIFTTNLPIGELRQVLGDRVASRLAQMTDRVVLTGPDRRRQSAV